MRVLIGSCLALATATAASFAAQKPAAKPASAKAAPVCASLSFRPLPAGTTDGEQIAGTYKSRFARLELNGTVQNGAPVNYYLAANGKRISATAQIPQGAVDCALSKKMPRPGPAKDACTGERFTAVLAHSGDKRIALLYAMNSSTWTFCSAGSF